MIKMIWRIALLILIGLAFAWLADRPGDVQIQWLGYNIKTKVIYAVAALGLGLILFWFILAFLRCLWRSPRNAREYWRFRKHKKAYESLSRGLIAAGAGDVQAANRLAAQASATLSNEPLLNVLSAQAAQLKGDRAAMKRAFEDMAKNPETEVLGLRGLFADSKQSGDYATAAQHAERALQLNPRLAWASSAMLQVSTVRKDWSKAAHTIASQGKSGLLPRGEADRKRAACLAAEALSIEESDQNRALTLALDAHGLDPSLVPAALVAARCYSASGNARKAMRVLRETWSEAQHPDLAEVMSHAKAGDSPEDRFERVRDLVGKGELQLEGAIALARAAIAARRIDVARKAILPYTEQSPQARVCALMAQIEDAQDDKGRAREWLARAVNAPRDPMWVSDGVASPRWTPVSPVTGEIVPCEWKAPYETVPLPLPDIAQGTSKEPPAPMIEAAKPQPQLLSATTTPPHLPDDPGVPSSETDRWQG
jgi:HemY protein